MILSLPPSFFLLSFLSLTASGPHLHIPIVWNCSGYERTETLRMLDGYIDIYLPDLKYFSPDTAKKYSARRIISLSHQKR